MRMCTYSAPTFNDNESFELSLSSSGGLSGSILAGCSSSFWTTVLNLCVGDGGGVGSGVLSPSALLNTLPVIGHNVNGLGGLTGSIGGKSAEKQRNSVLICPIIFTDLCTIQIFNLLVTVFIKIMLRTEHVRDSYQYKTYFRRNYNRHLWKLQTNILNVVQLYLSKYL